MRSTNTAYLIFILLAANAISWQAILGTKQKTARFAFLDIGQGDGTLIIGPRTTILYDDGPSGRRTVSEIAAVLPPYQHRIDLLVLSHSDKDHYGGTFEILRRYQVGLILTNTVPAHDSGWQELLRAAAAEHVPTLMIRAGTTITTPTESITVLNPPRDRFFASGRKKKPDFDNPNSVVLQVKEQGPHLTRPMTLLLTGDIDAAVEHYLVQHYQLASDYLLIPHHGSRFSSSAEFLRAVHPRLAVIQVGQHNRYGHPTVETLERIRQAGIPAWRTDTQGRLITE